MNFNFRNIDGDKFIGLVEQSSDYLNVLKFFEEEKIPMTFVTYKEYKDADVYEDYIIGSSSKQAQFQFHIFW